MKFRKGDKMFWKNTNTPAYEKVGDNDFDWWVSLDSKYLVETKVTNEVYVAKDKKNVNVEVEDEQLNLNDYLKKKVTETVHELRPESEKPLYRKDGTLNRFGFKWTDKQVYEHYKSFMNFVTN